MPSGDDQCRGNNHPLKITASLENATLGALIQYSVASNPMSRFVQTVMPESIEPSAEVERAMPQAMNEKLMCNVEILGSSVKFTGQQISVCNVYPKMAKEQSALYELSQL